MRRSISKMSPFHNHESYNAHSSDNIQATYLTDNNACCKTDVFIWANLVFPYFVPVPIPVSIKFRRMILWDHFINFIDKQISGPVLKHISNHPSLSRISAVRKVGVFLPDALLKSETWFSLMRVDL